MYMCKHCFRWTHTMFVCSECNERDHLPRGWNSLWMDATISDNKISVLFDLHHSYFPAYYLSEITWTQLTEMTVDEFFKGADICDDVQQGQFLLFLHRANITMKKE